MYAPFPWKRFVRVAETVDIIILLRGDTWVATGESVHNPGTEQDPGRLLLGVVMARSAVGSSMTLPLLGVAGAVAVPSGGEVPDCDSTPA